MRMCTYIHIHILYFQIILSTAIASYTRHFYSHVGNDATDTDVKTLAFFKSDKESTQYSYLVA